MTAGKSATFHWFVFCWVFYPLSSDNWSIMISVDCLEPPDDECMLTISCILVIVRRWLQSLLNLQDPDHLGEEDWEECMEPTNLSTQLILLTDMDSIQSLITGTLHSSTFQIMPFTLLYFRYCYEKSRWEENARKALIEDEMAMRAWKEFQERFRPKTRTKRGQKFTCIIGNNNRIFVDISKISLFQRLQYWYQSCWYYQSLC